MPIPKSLKRWIPVLAIAALALAVVASGAYRELNLDNLARYHDALQAAVAEHPVLAALTLAGAIATIVSSGLPGGAVFTVAGGLLFGTVPGALLAAAGNSIGASVLYFATRQFFATGRPPPAIAEKIRAGFNAHPVSYAFFVRLVPLFPFGATSITLAWLGCRYPLFLVSSILGVMPATLVYCALGSGLSQTIDEHAKIELSLLGQPRFLVPLAALAVLALVPVLVGWFRQRRT
jgi:uncharacterized membrane protein YdjX (TVP38/TMEM64 family)